MKLLTETERTELRRLVDEGIRVNSLRWDIEGQIEAVLGKQIQFIDFWGSWCVGTKAHATPKPLGDADSASAIDELLGANEV